MVSHGEDLGLGVKMVHWAHLHAPRGDSKGLVLDGLESIDGRRGGVGKPGGGGISEE